MSCDPERVTAYVDRALEPALEAPLELHLAGCADCRAQAGFEKALAAQLRRLPPIAPPPGLESRLRAALRPRRRVAPWVAALAAGLALAVLWGPSAPPVLARALAADHAHCHAVRVLAVPLEPSDLADAEIGPTLRSIPRQIAGLPLASVAVCELMDGSFVVHLQYVDGDRRVSLFVSQTAAAFGGGYRGRVGASDVRLIRAKGRAMGLVADGVDLEAFERALSN